MVADDNERSALTRSGRRVIDAHALAPQLRVVEKMPEAETSDGAGRQARVATRSCTCCAADSGSLLKKR
jgi:hypothetical protein